MGIFKKSKIYNSKFNNDDLLNIIKDVKPKKLAFSLFDKNLYEGKITGSDKFKIEVYSFRWGINRVEITGEIQNGFIKISYRYYLLVPVLIGLLAIVMSIVLFFVENITINGIVTEAKSFDRFTALFGMITLILILLFGLSLYYLGSAMGFVEDELKLKEFE